MTRKGTDAPIGNLRLKELKTADWAEIEELNQIASELLWFREKHDAVAPEPSTAAKEEIALSDRQLCLLSLVWNSSTRAGVDDQFAINKWIESKIASVRAARLTSQPERKSDGSN